MNLYLLHNNFTIAYLLVAVFEYEVCLFANLFKPLALIA